MNAFFQGQMDYIFFFYGLAFIGLGVVCYTLSKEVNQRLPWIWLAFFGFSHGLNEWLDLVALAWQDGLWFAVCRWVVMAASFLSLLEFGRLSLIRQGNRMPGRWVLGILVLSTALGAMYGLSGLNVTTRYALGLVGSLGAGWALCREGRQADPRHRFSLLAGGVGLMLYGLATGVIVPRAPFFPVATVNYQTFASLTGLPIQLVRGLLACWISVMVMGYFQISWPAEYERCHRDRARYMYGVNLALVVILIAGWVLTQYLGQVALEQVRRDTASHSNLIIQRLIFELEGADAAVKAMAGSPWINSASWSRSPQTLAQANSVLDRYQSRFGASPAYILDQTGTTIASSNRNDRDSFVGHNYGFRPYFQHAMAGKPGRYFALGVLSKKRGFYAAYPVQNQAGKIVGAAAIKTTLDKFQQELRASDPAFLIDPDGVIFLSSRPSLDYHSLWPVNRTDKGTLKVQYGTADFEAVFPRPLTVGDTVKIDGESYLFYRQEINSYTAPDWSMVVLTPVKQVVFYRLLGIGVSFVFVLLILIFVGTNLSIREGANRILISESRFRAMFDAAPEAVYVFDPKTRKIIDANPFMAQWLGYDLQELIGLEIDQVRAPDSLGPQEECARAGSEGPNLTPGPLYRKKDGTLVDVECTAANILHGDHIREIVFVRDITARKKVAVELVWEAMVNSAIADLSKSLLTSLPLVKIASLVNDHAVNLTGSQEAFCGHINPLTGALAVSAITGKGWASCQIKDQPAKFHKFGGLVGWVLEHGQPLLTNHPDQDPRSAGTPLGYSPIHRFLAVPAMIEDRLVGLIALANAARDYSPRDQEICERLALLYAQAIHRQRLDEILRESESGLQTILDNVQTGVLIINPETHVIVDANPVAVKMIGTAKADIIGKVCHQFICTTEAGQCPITDLHGTLNNSERILLRANGEKSWILKTVVPVMLKGKSHLLESFVDITERRQWEEAVQTTNDRLQVLVAKIEEQNRTMTLTNEMADMMQACQASEEAYGTIGHFMPRFFPNDAGALYMLNNSRNLFDMVASWGKTPPAISVFAPDDCWSVRRGRLHKVDNPREALLCRHVSALCCGGYLCVPLVAQGETLGVLHLESGSHSEGPEAGPSMLKEQLALALAEDMALALANLRLRETLRSQAIRDPLTGLFNRRYMEETLERELNRAKRAGSPIAVIMMDLDHFKTYNDTFGHNAGDEILSALGNLVKSQIRGEDIACRYGGEEFLLIIPGAAMGVALERAELLRQAVKGMHVHQGGLKPITLSLGVAVYPVQGETGLDLIRAADAVLYQAKRAGRDRVMAAADPGESQKVSLSDTQPHSLEGLVVPPA
jgi:diguanylate cyclase (GGDEF)-like protein/PAS domain S-box-containing protein